MSRCVHCVVLIFDTTQRTRKKFLVFPVSGLPNHAVALEQAVVQTRQCQLEALMKASTLELRHEVALPSCRILASRNSFRCSLPTVEYLPTLKCFRLQVQRMARNLSMADDTGETVIGCCDLAVPQSQPKVVQKSDAVSDVACENGQVVGALPGVESPASSVPKPSSPCHPRSVGAEDLQAPDTTKTRDESHPRIKNSCAGAVEAKTEGDNGAAASRREGRHAANGAQPGILRHHERSTRAAAQPAQMSTTYSARLHSACPVEEPYNEGRGRPPQLAGNESDTAAAVATPVSIDPSGLQSGTQAPIAATQAQATAAHPHVAQEERPELELPTSPRPVVYGPIFRAVSRSSSAVSNQAGQYGQVPGVPLFSSSISAEASVAVAWPDSSQAKEAKYEEVHNLQQTAPHIVSAQATVALNSSTLDAHRANVDRGDAALAEGRCGTPMSSRSDTSDDGASDGAGRERHGFVRTFPSPEKEILRI